MAVSPTGSLARPLHLMRNIFLGSTAWQNWVGGPVAGSTFLVAAPAQFPGVHAIIDHDKGLTRTRIRVGAGPFNQTGNVLAYISAPIGVAGDNGDAETDFFNNLDLVLSDFEAVAGQFGNGLYLHAWSLEGGPNRITDNQRDKNGDTIEALISFSVTVQT